MTTPGAFKRSMRGSLPWRGMTTLTQADAGDRRLSFIEGGYINNDGAEIRMVPGFRAVFDPVSSGRVSGYRQQFLDSARPASAVAGNYRQQTSPSESQKTWIKETNIHCMDLVRGQLLIVGESEFVREPLMTAGGVEVHGVSWSTAAHTVVALDGIPQATADDKSATGLFNAVSPTGAATCPSFVYIETEAGGELAGKIHQVRQITGSNLTLETTAAAGASWNPVATISRVRPIGDTTYPKVPQPDGNDDPECLTAWKATSPGDPEGAIIVNFDILQVANRMRDHGDVVGCVIEGRETTYWKSRRRKMSLPLRLSPTRAGDRLLLAAPGVACCFQVPVLMPEDSANYLIQDFFRPRSLGVPKAVMYEDTEYSGSGGGVPNSWHTPVVGSAATAYGGSDASVTGRAGTYKFTVCYRDDVTGEVGIAADAITVTTDTAFAFQGIRLACLFPGYLLSETAAITLLVFRTDKGGSVLKYQQTISPINSMLGGATSSGRFGLQPPTGTTEDQLVVFTIPFVADTELDATFGPPDGLVQMPMGAKAIRVIRGQTFYVGQYGTAGLRHERLAAGMRFHYDTGALAGSLAPDRDRFIMEASQATTPDPVNGFRWGLGNGTISPAYSGQTLSSNSAEFPYPRLSVTLDSLTNARSAYDQIGLNFPIPDAHWPRFKILETPLRKGDGWDQRNPSFISLPRGLYQIALPGQHGQTPAINNGIADDELEDDLEAIGSLHGQALMATRSATYLLAWSSDPTLTTPSLLDRTYGCIASNTMCEFDGGCAWISEHGPVATMGGPIEWIGRDLQERFVGTSARYLRDSEGMMRHAWGCHDPERGLVYFGVFSNRNNTSITFRGVSTNWASADDKAKSRFPCDEVLIWSYKTNAWSVWYPPAGLEVLWMARWPDVRGKPRIWFMGADKRIYCFDDSFAQWNRNPLNLAVTALSNGTTVTVNATSQPAAQPWDDTLTARNNNTFIAVGMNVLVTDSTKLVCKGTAMVTGYNVAAHTVTLSNAVSVLPGDFLIVGVRSMTVTTNFLNGNGSEPTTLRGVEPRYSIWSEYQLGGPSAAQPAFGRVTDFVNKRLGQTDASVVNPISSFIYASDQSNGGWKLLGTSYTQGLSQDQWFGEGGAVGQEHQVKVEILGAAQVRLQDLTVQLP